jgi:heme A synthase
LDTKRDLDTLLKWTKVGKFVSAAFLALMAVSIATAVYEYYTLEDAWTIPAALTFGAAMLFGVLSAMVMRLQRHWKDRAIASLEKEVATQEKA